MHGDDRVPTLTISTLTLHPFSSFRGAKRHQESTNSTYIYHGDNFQQEHSRLVDPESRSCLAVQDDVAEQLCLGVTCYKTLYTKIQTQQRLLLLLPLACIRLQQTSPLYQHKSGIHHQAASRGNSFSLPYQAHPQ